MNEVNRQKKREMFKKNYRIKQINFDEFPWRRRNAKEIKKMRVEKPFHCLIDSVNTKPEVVASLFDVSRNIYVGSKTCQRLTAMQEKTKSEQKSLRFRDVSF